jgi:hypothetical protein
LPQPCAHVGTLEKSDRRRFLPRRICQRLINFKRMRQIGLDDLQDIGQGLLLLGEASQHVFAGMQDDALDLDEQLPRLIGQMNAPQSAIAGNRPPLDPAAFLDLVDKSPAVDFSISSSCEICDCDTPS